MTVNYVVRSHWGQQFQGYTSTKTEAENKKKQLEARGIPGVTITKLPKIGAKSTRLGNPSSRSRSSRLRKTPNDRTPWIPVRRVKFVKGQVLLDVSKTVARSLKAGERLGNPADQKWVKTGYDSWALVTKSSPVRELGNIYMEDTGYGRGYVAYSGSSFGGRRLRAKPYDTLAQAKKAVSAAKS